MHTPTICWSAIRVRRTSGRAWKTRYGSLYVMGHSACLARTRPIQAMLPTFDPTICHRFPAASIAHHYRPTTGEDQPEVLRTMERLRTAGIGGILDYAAEDDVQPTPTTASKSPPSSQTYSSSSKPATEAAPAAPAPATATGLTHNGRVVARQYNYASEVQCDKHVEIFKSAISTAASMPMQGFAAVKMTGLGNPILLQRITDAIREVSRGAFWYGRGAVRYPALWHGVKLGCIDCVKSG